MLTLGPVEMGPLGPPTGPPRVAPGRRRSTVQLPRSERPPQRRRAGRHDPVVQTLSPRARARFIHALPVLAGVTALAGCGSTSDRPTTRSPASPRPETLQSRFVNVVKSVSPAVVQIRTPTALRSGIAFDARGDIVTNAHVVAGAKRFVVTLPGGKRAPAKLVGTDPANDLAVIHMTGATPRPATFADSSKVTVGDLALAIGNPLGLQSSVTQGIVSNLNREVGEGNGITLANVIQTSAEINPGNSGGALVDLDGRVIGIPTLAALDPNLGDAQAPGIGFAIASNRVRSVARAIIAGGR
jgi:putative serine protease PepD